MFQTNLRQAWRFPLVCDLRYQTLNRRKPTNTGSGKTLNLSSSGIWFTCQQTFPVGTRLELSIQWPAKRSNGLPVVLIVLGRVTRQDKDGLALSIDSYRFR